MAPFRGAISVNLDLKTRTSDWAMYLARAPCGQVCAVAVLLNFTCVIYSDCLGGCSRVLLLATVAAISTTQHCNQIEGVIWVFWVISSGVQISFKWAKYGGLELLLLLLLLPPLIHHFCILVERATLCSDSCLSLAWSLAFGSLASCYCCLLYTYPERVWAVRLMAVLCYAIYLDFLSELGCNDVGLVRC